MKLWKLILWGISLSSLPVFGSGREGSQGSLSGLQRGSKTRLSWEDYRRFLTGHQSASFVEKEQFIVCEHAAFVQLRVRASSVEVVDRVLEELSKKSKDTDLLFSLWDFPLPAQHEHLEEILEATGKKFQSVGLLETRMRMEFCDSSYLAKVLMISTS